jgi:AcrR family transcriptional regulator
MARGAAGDPDRTVELLWREGRSGPRPGLTLDRIVGAGVELADAEGLAGLSMRKVAERLGFTTMSLYRHVPGRDQLIDLMRDAVVGEAPPRTDPGGADWRTRLEACARDGWELRRRHPWLAEVRGARHVPGPHAVALYERMLSAVADTGLTPAEAVAAAGLVGRFLDSEALLLVEAAEAERRTGVSDEQWWGGRHAVFERLADYPTITRLWTDGAYDRPVDPFEFGLARLLDGIGLLIRDRYETRDTRGVCAGCGGPVDRTTTGRPRTYCSAACRQRAYRGRRAGGS